MAAERTEISFEVSPEEVAVLDGYCSAKNLKRTQVYRKILREWSEEQHRVATVIIRVAGVKPEASEARREIPE